MNGREKASDFRTSMRLALFDGVRKKRKVYVMVQRGFPNDVMAVGMSKHEIKNSILGVAVKKYTFNEWANIIKKRAQK